MIASTPSTTSLTRLQTLSSLLRGSGASCAGESPVALTPLDTCCLSTTSLTTAAGVADGGRVNWEQVARTVSTGFLCAIPGLGILEGLGGAATAAMSNQSDLYARASAGFGVAILGNVMALGATTASMGSAGFALGLAGYALAVAGGAYAGWNFPTDL